MRQVILIIALVMLAASVIRRLVAAMTGAGRWNQSYERLSKRYAGKQGNRGGAIHGYGVNQPSLAFDYGRTFCTLHNRKSARFSTGRVTEISMVWPNRKLKLEISTSPIQARSWGPGGMKQVLIEDPKFRSDYFVSASDPVTASHLLSSGVLWQIEQLRRLMGNNELLISITRGSLNVSKLKYVKQ